MSHQVRPSSSQSSSPHDVRGFHSAQSAIPTPQVSPTKLPAMIPADNRHQNPGGRGLPAPSPQVSSERSPSAERSSRGLGVQALINPQSHESHEPRGRRRSAAQMESPSPVDSVSALSLPPLSRPNSRDYGEEEWSIPPGGPPRRILSPRSPRLNRTRSLGILGAPTGSIDAHQQPFPGAANPPSMGGPPTSLRGTYYHPATAPTPPPQMLLPGVHRRASGSMVPSGSVSPTMSLSSVAQTGHSPATSLIQPAGNTPLQTPGQTPPSMHIGLSHSGPAGNLTLPGPAHPPDDRPTVGIPVMSSHSNYQIFTVNTRQGHQVTIPVDVQAASRVADEKRRRNAGASARFRARRKEKEREASALISKLEQQVVEANEDVDFYRRERDALAELLYNSPGGHAHFPRPQSPHRRRPSVASSGINAPSSTTGSSASVSGAPVAQSASASSDRPERSEGERNVRRRTSAYLPPISSTAPGRVSPPSGPSLGGPPGNVNYPLGQPPGPMQEDLSSRQHPGPPTAQPSPQRPGAHNMFVERFDRSWPPGTGPTNGGDHRRQ